MATQRTRWLVVLGSTVALIVSNGPIFLFSFGVFLKPVSETFGWSRATMSLGLTLGLILGGLATPVVGRLVDRWGSQRVTLVNITLFAASFAAISLIPGNIVAFILAYSLCGMFAGGQAPLPYARSISGWFETRRGLALGIAMAGIGIGIALMPKVADILLQRLGWRPAYAVLGLIAWLVAFPAVLLFVKDPPEAGPVASPMDAGDDVGGVLGSRPFWLMTVACFLVVTVLNGTNVHLVALLTDRGVSQDVAVSAIIVVGLAAIVGRVASGFLLDRCFAPFLAAGVFLVPLIAVAVLLDGLTARPFVLLVASCFGLALGAEVDVIGFLVGRYFGLRRYGEVYGYIFAAFTIGSGLGPYLLGLSFDRTGSYTFALVGAGITLVLSSVLIACLGPYRYPASAKPASEPGIGLDIPVSTV